MRPVSRPSSASQAATLVRRAVEAEPSDIRCMITIYQDDRGMQDGFSNKLRKLIHGSKGVQTVGKPTDKRASWQVGEEKVEKDKVDPGKLFPPKARPVSAVPLGLSGSGCTSTPYPARTRHEYRIMHRWAIQREGTYFQTFAFEWPTESEGPRLLSLCRTRPQSAAATKLASQAFANLCNEKDVFICFILSFSTRIRSRLKIA